MMVGEQAGAQTEGVVADGWIVLTHDGRLPVPGGLPVTSASSDMSGLQMHAELTGALRDTSLWPLGRPAAVLRVSIPADDAGAPATLAERHEINTAIDRLSEMFGDDHADMFGEQVAWLEALARPAWSSPAVAASLRETLVVRGLESWTLRPFEQPSEVWQAWLAWAGDSPAEARHARDDWGERHAFAAKRQWERHGGSLAHGWHAWGPWAPSQSRTFDTANPLLMRDLCAARASFAAHFALTFRLAAARGWVQPARELLSLGIRDAYLNGLEVALPVAPKTLGWAMADGMGR